MRVKGYALLSDAENLRRILRREYDRKRRESLTPEQLEQINAKQRERYARNREKRLKWARNYYKKHREQRLEYRKQYVKEHHEKVKLYDRRRYKRRRDRLKEYMRQYYIEHREQILARQRMKYNNRILQEVA
jgi:hypothetical protein